MRENREKMPSSAHRLSKGDRVAYTGISWSEEGIVETVDEETVYVQMHPKKDVRRHYLGKMTFPFGFGEAGLKKVSRERKKRETSDASSGVKKKSTGKIRLKKE